MRILPLSKDFAVACVIGFSGLSLRATESSEPPPGALATSSGESSVSVKSTDARWTGIRSAHELWKHRFVRNSDGSVHATNPGQQWQTFFDGQGFIAEPEAQSWLWGLELTSYGFGEDRHSVEGSANLKVKGEKLSYLWDGNLEEWFINDSRGLEQGWTLKRRPTGNRENPLTLDLRIRGNLRPTVLPGKTTISFLNDKGNTVLTYGGLKAWDASGSALPTCFVSRKNGIAVMVDDSSATYPVTIDPVAQQAYLKASNTGSADRFGNSVAISGDTAVVGAPYESSSTTGVNGPSNELAAGSGAAYVFTWDGSNWSQQAFLKPSNTDANDNFGYSVAISGDTIVVGAPFESSSTTGVNTTPNESASNAGAAYVFTRTTNVWSEQAYLKASNTGAGDTFGWSVAISENTLVVGANGEKSSTTGVDSVSNDSGNLAGAAYVFSRSGMAWSQQAYLKASNTGDDDEFGWSVGVSGDTVVVGAKGEDSSTAGVNPGSNEAAADSGAAYVFSRSGMTWSHQAFIKPSNTSANDMFGTSVAATSNLVVVGAPFRNGFTGAAYVFSNTGGDWFQQAILQASNGQADDQLGTSVAASGSSIIAGAYREDSSSVGVDSVPNELAPNSGAAYIFNFIEGKWFQQSYIKASNTGADDGFGWSVAVSDNLAIVGSPFEASSSTGIDSVPDEASFFAGAAYPFSTFPDALVRPSIKVKGQKRITTSRSRYLLKGTASDSDLDIVRVEARDSRNSGRKKYRKAKGDEKWKYKAKLRPGRNVVKIRAVDSTSRKSAVKRIKIIRR